MTIRVLHSGVVSQAIAETMGALVADKVASRIFQKDATLWGKDAEPESAIRLGWVHAAANSLPLVAELVTLREELLGQGVDRIVLCGMGGSSLAPEVITKTAGVDLVVLDSTEPSQVLDVISTAIEKTAVIVSSKSGSTVETDSQKRSFEMAFADKGIDKTKRLFIVTDPDSPMHLKAVEDGYRVFLADPMVGGRYSALTAFGVVPSVLAGVKMDEILQSAIDVTPLLASDSEENPALVLGAAMARTRCSTGYKDKIGFVPAGTAISGFGEWVEQLIAESTGKQGRGVLPIVLDSISPEISSAIDDLLLVELAGDTPSKEASLSVSGNLGEQLLLWEVATAVASRLLEVNPFDQPDVESAKIAARAMLEGIDSKASYPLEDQGVQIASFGFSPQGTSLDSVLINFFEQLPANGYLGVQAYLNREQITGALPLRNLLAKGIKRPVTFGWGPRFLHSTGQYHKGGPKQGIFLQLLSGEEIDLSIPGRDFGYRKLIESQALGDAKVLAEKGLAVLVLRLSNPQNDIDRLIGMFSKQWS